MVKENIVITQKFSILNKTIVINDKLNTLIKSILIIKKSLFCISIVINQCFILNKNILIIKIFTILKKFRIS